MDDYSYQPKAADSILHYMLNTDYIAAVLAACPGAGKTTISHYVLNQYLKLFPNAKVLVLTEGQKVLSNQYIHELHNAHIPIEFTYGGFSDNVQVRVGLPHSIDKLEWNEIDLILVDESHNFYLEPMVQKIIKKLKPKHQMLMTGSPSKFNLHNETTSGRKYGIHYISAEELQKRDIFSSVDVDVTIVRDIKNPAKTIKDVLTHAHWEGDDASKMMVACPTIDYAKGVSEYLKSIGRKVSLSTSENDKDSEEINRFKNNETDVLVVVNRGILGFNDGEITFLADLRSSEDLDAGYQLFARVLRKHPKGKRKAYIRVSKDNEFKKQSLTVHKMLALMKRAVFTKFNGKNFDLDMMRSYL